MSARGFHVLTALALLVLGSCEKVVEPKVSQTYTFTIEATKDGEPEVKALTVDGSRLVSTWNLGDLVYVYNRNTGTFLEGTIQPEPADYGKTTATLTGTLSGTVEVGNNLKLYIHQKGNVDFEGQTGSLGNVSSYYDVATGFARVKAVEGGRIVPEEAITFTSEQAIVKFVFSDKSGARIYPTRLKLDIQNAAGDHYIQRWAEKDGDSEGVLELSGIDPANTADGIYVAIRVRPDDDPTPITKMLFEAEDGSFKYTGEVAGRISFQNGKYYVRNVTFTKDATFVGTETLLSNAQKDKHLGWVVDKEAKIYPPEAVKKGAVDAKAVIVYFDDANTPGKHLCIARNDMTGFEGSPESNWERACNNTDAHWYTNWVEANFVKGYKWKTPSRDDWTNIWKYKMQNFEGSAVFPVRDLLSAAGTSLADDKAYYWTSTGYSADQAYVFQIWDFEGRFETVDGEYRYGFLDAYTKMTDTDIHTRYVFTF